MDLDQELFALKGTADGAMRAAGPSQRDEMLAMMQKIDDVRAFARQVGGWQACLKCGSAFETDEQHSQHYWRAHR